MTRIDYYHHVANPHAFACKLANTVLRRGERLTVLLPDSAALKAFDQQLWSDPPTGFVPHCGLHHPLLAETPVVLTTTLPETPATPVLLNLSLALPAGFADYSRILEVVSHSEDSLGCARDTARAYKAAGCPATYHDMTGK